MSFGAIDYICDRFRPSPSPILVMSILVRDEADIIADNILFHSKQGVDAFVVGDNASTDGTREKVEKLAKELPVHIVDFPEGQYRQTTWRTHMARIAYRKFKATRVISNDADEFWYTESGNLKQELPRSKAIMRVERFNMLFLKKKDYYQSPWRVISPVHYRSKYQKKNIRMSISLAKLAPKVIVDPRGLLFVRGGNHRAFHLFYWGIPSTSQDILIYHFPMRGYREFLRSVRHRAEVMQNDPSTHIGPHDLRWINRLKEGKLAQEYEDLIFSPDEMNILQKLGFVVKDFRLIERFKQLGLIKELANQ